MRVKNELQHHGILGMRWGIRRFQKKDGSLTSAGKKRYSDDADQAADKKTKNRGKKQGSRVQKGKSFVNDEEDMLLKDLLENYDENDPDFDEAMELLDEMMDD